VPDRVPAQLDVGRLPPTQRLRGGWEAGVDAEVVQEAVGIEIQQQRAVEIHRPLERTVEEADLAQRERPGLEGDFVGDGGGECRCGDHDDSGSDDAAHEAILRPAASMGQL